MSLAGLTETMTSTQFVFGLTVGALASRTVRRVMQRKVKDGLSGETDSSQNNQSSGNTVSES